MIDLIEINKSNINAFKPMIRDEAAAYIEASFNMNMEQDLIMLGFTDDNVPFAFICCDLDEDEGIADIISLFVRKEYRRKGFATDLVISVATTISQYEADYILKCSFTKGKDYGDDLKGLFSYLEFSENELSDVGCYACTLNELKKIKMLETPTKLNFKKISELSRAEKNLLAEEKLQSLLDDLNAGEYDEDLSLFLSEDDRIKACLCMKKTDKDVTMAWARVDSDCQIALIQMFCKSFSNMCKVCPDDTVVKLPYINNSSKTLIEKMLGNKADKIETNYEFSYVLYDTEMAM